MQLAFFKKMKPSVQDAITRQAIAWTKLPIPVWL